MSREASLFPIHFFDCDIYCKKCGRVTKSKIFSQEKYDKNYGKSEIPPNKPLYCKCESCGGFEIYATNEFAELQEEPLAGLCKIWGAASLETGDLVFHPEHKLCIVDSINSGYLSSPKIELINQKRKKIVIEVESLPEEPENLYRLFPDDFENARIGDKIYHTETKVAGSIVGLEFNGMQTIFVRQGNGSLAKYACENDHHYLTDDVLEKNAKWRCKDLTHLEKLQIISKSKIIYASCIISDFSTASELKDILSTIPQARCSVLNLAVAKTDINPNIIYMELLKNFIYICCCKVEIENEELYISGFYSSKETPKLIYRALSKFPIKKINLRIKLRSDLKSLKTISQTNGFIKISRIEKTIHIDGWVKSEKEKKRANLKAFLCSFSFKIENHLLVVG